jgi:pimeloyl-ACP methyl ester carboxylesterase
VKISAGWQSQNGSMFRASAGKPGCVHLTNYTVDYCEWGDGPPLVIIPGLAGGYELLGPLAKLLAQDHRIISYQLRGEDNCFALRRPFTREDLVKDLAEFLDCMGLESPSLMGVSFGGVLAMEFAARHPYRLKDLIIQGAGSRFERGLLQTVASTVLARLPLPSDNPFVNQFFNLLFGGAIKKDALYDFVIRQIWQTDQSMMAYRFQLAETFNIVDRLPRIRVPTLILAGDKDVLVTTRSLNELVQGIGNAQLKRLPRSGHLAFVTNPGLVAHQVREFLAEK